MEIFRTFVMVIGWTTYWIIAIGCFAIGTEFGVVGAIVGLIVGMTVGLPIFGYSYNYALGEIK